MFAHFVVSLMCFLFIFYCLIGLKKWYLQIWYGILISSVDKHILNKVNDIVFIQRKAKERELKHIYNSMQPYWKHSMSHSFEKL